MSSSSSVCDFEEFYSYHPLRSYQEPWYDYYQTMGHPLIYYAEVQPSSRRSRDGVRKDPNFFVKAFRWYTQEHHPPPQDQEKAVTNPDFLGFASWLDAKYGEYIQEEQRDQQQINQLTVPEPRKPKKLLASMKSHFTRRHKTKKDGVRQKSCNSCEYILMPKEMSLTGSDFRRSNTKAMCSNTPEKKSAMKSVSMSSIRYDIDYQKSIEIVTTEGDMYDKPEEACSCARTEVLMIYESKPNNTNVSIGTSPPPNVETVCGKPPDKSEANTQCDKNMCASISPVRPGRPVSPAPPVTSKNKVEIQKQDKNKSIPSIAKKTSNPRKSPKMSDVSCLCSLERVPTNRSTKSAKSFECQCTAAFQDVAKPLHQKDKNKSIPSIAKKTSNPRKSPKMSDVSCLCSLERVPTSRSTKSAKSFECQCTASFQDVAEPLHQTNVATNYISVCSCAPKQQPPMTLPTPKVTPVVPVMPVPPPPAPVVTPAPRCLCSIRVNDAMQTSDTSIRLDDEVIKYPFFMKIVRADKLITDC